MSFTAALRRPPLIFLFLMFFYAPGSSQFQTALDVNDLTFRAVDQLQTHFDVNNISSRIPNIIQEFQSQNIIKLNARRKLSDPTHRATENDTQCNHQLSLFADGLSKLEAWAMKMADASSKIPSGVLIGNMIDLGIYDECVSVEVKVEDELIRGRHCMYLLSITIPNTAFSLPPKLSICVPAVCSAQQVWAMLQNVTNKITDQIFKVDVASVHCSSADSQPLDTGEIVAIVILSALLCFLVGCTVCDIFIRATSTVGSESILNKFAKFSFYTNIKRIFDLTIPRNNVPAIQGIRFFSMCWIILGHGYIVPMTGAVMNILDVLEWSTSWKSIFIFLALFAVDTFFVLSGFLTSYLFIKEMSQGRKFNVIMYYVHRYIRLTPAFAALIVLSIYVFPRVGSGALWEFSMMTQKEVCERNWWLMLLYVHNYLGEDSVGCLGHTWYLAVDMQLFWISPLILYPLVKKPKVGLGILGILAVASVITPAVIAGENQYSLALIGAKGIAEMQQMMQGFYIVSYTRAGPWLFGIYVGYKLASKTNKPSLNFMAAGWTLTVLAFGFIFFTYRIFQNKDYEWCAPWEIFYAGFGRHIWAFGICWLIYASAIGYVGFIGRFLTLPVFIPFGRISYCVYLMHMVIQTMKTSAIRVPVYFSDFEKIYSFFGEFVTCIIAGLVLSLTCESPFLVLEKLIFGST